VPRSSPEILRLRLRRDRSAPRRVRRALEQVDAIGRIRDDAILVASELATNALRHAYDDGPDEIELVAELVPDGVRIAVTDTGASDPEGGPRPAGAAEPDRISLRIVQAIARRWGTERVDGHRTWAVLAI